MRRVIHQRRKNPVRQRADFRRAQTFRDREIIDDVERGLKNQPQFVAGFDQPRPFEGGSARLSQDRAEPSFRFERKAFQRRPQRRRRRPRAGAFKADLAQM
jgi:hypothetical protein